MSNINVHNFHVLQLFFLNLKIILKNFVALSPHIKTFNLYTINISHLSHYLLTYHHCQSVLSSRDERNCIYVNTDLSFIIIIHNLHHPLFKRKMLPCNLLVYIYFSNIFRISKSQKYIYYC